MSEQDKIQNIIDYMVLKDINFKDLSGNGVVLLQGEYDLSDRDLRGLINTCFINKYALEFNKNKFYIHKGL